MMLAINAGMQAANQRIFHPARAGLKKTFTLLKTNRLIIALAFAPRRRLTEPPPLPISLEVAAVPTGACRFRIHSGDGQKNTAVCFF
jgi:hypothetical protein